VHVLTPSKRDELLTGNGQQRLFQDGIFTPDALTRATKKVLKLNNTKKN
jgi:hypothetical protein